MSGERPAGERHDALDGVPQPAEHAALVGHQRAAELVWSAHMAGKLPHALLLSGPQGIGKATFALRLAVALLEHPSSLEAPKSFPQADPRSPAFRQLASGAHPSVLHLTRPPGDGARAFKSVIPVDEIRRVGRFLSMTTHDGGYRVVIVDPVDDLNTSAANALLKNLEEPPRRTLFVLVSHVPGGLLPTIRSRCQVVRLQPLSDVELVSALDALGVALPGDDEERGRILSAAGGSVREAILLTQFGGADIDTALRELVSTSRLDIAGAYRLADVVAARDHEIRFELFNASATELLEQAARGAAQESRGPRAGRLARAWEEMCVAVSDAQTYNLDRKQHALNMIRRLHETLRM
jgi:DNA polymerase-3 subunit delta'